MTRQKVDDVLLVAYLDGEIAPAAARRIEKLMGQDPALAQRVAMFRRSAVTLRAALPVNDFTDIPLRLVPTIRQSGRKGRPGWRSFILPIAATLAGIAIGVGSLDTMSHLPADGRDSELATLRNEVSEYHAVYAAEREHLIEVPASRKDHLEAWLGQRVKLPIRAPDLSTLKLNFAGGRMLVVNGQPVALVFYVGEAGQRVALCVGQMKSTTQPAVIGDVKLVDDVKLVGKMKGNHMFVVAGPAGDPVVDVVAKNLPQLLSRS